MGFLATFLARLVASRALLPVGSEAPDFELDDHQGRRVRLRDLRGERVVLWFFPKASTPGCTRQGCAFRDLHAEFVRKHVRVLGASFDTPAAPGAAACRAR